MTRRNAEDEMAEREAAGTPVGTGADNPFGDGEGDSPTGDVGTVEGDLKGQTDGAQQEAEGGRWLGLKEPQSSPAGQTSHFKG